MSLTGPSLSNDAKDYKIKLLSKVKRSSEIQVSVQRTKIFQAFNHIILSEPDVAAFASSLTTFLSAHLTAT